MLKKRLIVRLTVIIVILIIVAILVNVFRGHNGRAITIEFDGNKIRCSDTMPKELVSKGFSIENSDCYYKAAQVDSRTYTDEINSLYKDEVKYCDFSVINKSHKTKDMEECSILDVTFFYKDKNDANGKIIKTFKGTKIDGFNPFGMTKEEVKLKSSRKFSDTNDGIETEDGKHYCKYHFDEDGKVYSVTVGVDL